MDFRRQLISRAPRAVIVLGAGEVGFNVADRLSKEGRQVVVVDRDQAQLSVVQNALDVQVLQGSASSPEILERAGAAEAEIVIAVTGNDEINMVACLLANLLNPASLKLARLRNEEYARQHDLLGPDCLNVRAVINPDVEVVNTVMRMFAAPRAVDYGEFGQGRIKVVAIEIRSGPLLGRPLTEFPKVTPDEGVRIGGILRGEKLILPSGLDVIEAGDVVYFVCLEESLATAFAIADAEQTSARRVCIVGGGDIGLRLARLIDGEEYRVKLVERDAERCAFLADQLVNVTVLNGDGTDREFMREENIGDMDMMVALTGDEESNILACLLAKSIGTPGTITRVNKNAYMPIVRAIGLKLSVNPRMAATNSIVHFLRRGMRLSSIITHDEDVEMLEAVIGNDSRVAGKPLRDSPFPKGTNLLAVARGNDVFIPKGNSVLTPGDRVTMVCERARLSWVESNVIGKQ